MELFVPGSYLEHGAVRPWVLYWTWSCSSLGLTLNIELYVIAPYLEHGAVRPRALHWTCSCTSLVLTLNVELYLPGSAYLWRREVGGWCVCPGCHVATTITGLFRPSLRSIYVYKYVQYIVYNYIKTQFISCIPLLNRKVEQNRVLFY